MTYLWGVPVTLTSRNFNMMSCPCLSKSIIYIVVILLPATNLLAQKDKFPFQQFERITKEDGLPGNSVYGVMQDKYGFLWFLWCFWLIRLRQPDKRNKQDKPDRPDKRIGLSTLSADPHCVSPLNRSALHDGCINADVAVVLLHGGAQDAAVFRQIALRKRRHHAAAAGPCDHELHVADGQLVADPGLFDETLLSFRRVYHYVRPEARDFEAARPIGLTKPIERDSGDEMDGRPIKKRCRRAG